MHSFYVFTISGEGRTAVEQKTEGTRVHEVDGCQSRGREDFKTGVKTNLILHFACLNKVQICYLLP